MYPSPESPHLPAALPMEAVHWLASGPDLASAAKLWERCPVLGIDTEFCRERTYYPRLGLIQISDGKEAWLVDAPAIEDWAPLVEVMLNDGIFKLMHAAREDLEVLRLVLGAAPRPLIDTQVAAALVGLPPSLSYGALVANLLGVELSKAHARSNWLKRPLPPELIEYAALDVFYLPPIWLHLEARLQKLNRLSWLEAEMQTEVKEVSIGDTLQAHFRRLPGIGDADAKTQAVAYHLCQWRDSTARRLDLPRTFVLRNEHLMALAAGAPQTLAEIEALATVQAKQARRYGRQWLECIANATPGSAPEIPRSDAEFQRRVRSWQKQVKKKAETLYLHPTVLLSRREIERLLRHGPESLPGGLCGWRYAVLAAELTDLGND